MRVASKIYWLLLVLLPAFIVSCGSLENQSTGLHFHESATADLVLIYYGPASIFVTKPDTREGGFLPLKTREDVLQDISRPEIGRNLAVVVVGYMNDGALLDQLMQGWQSDLAGRGYHRVVFLRSGRNDKIDGLLILRDSVIASRDAKPAKTGLALAAVTPAP